MNEAAYEAINEAWQLTVRTRALCPHAQDSAIGKEEYESPSWYQERDANFRVKPIEPLQKEDIEALRKIGRFVNQSFVISMAAILEEHDVIPYGVMPDDLRNGGKHAKLTKLLRHRFAHGQSTFDLNDKEHVKTRDLLEELFPDEAKHSDFPIPIDTVLEPLKNGVLRYIQATT